MTTRLFHVSDRPDIAIFHPRWSKYTDRPVVWAVEESRLCNYLLPRDCPRVCFRAGTDSSAGDIAELLGDDEAIVAVEDSWRNAIENCALYVYDIPAEGFVLQDEAARYWVSAAAIAPLGVSRRTDLPSAIAATGATLRYLPSLWKLHDRVAASTLVFSMIRMRNAAPRLPAS